MFTDPLVDDRKQLSAALFALKSQFLKVLISELFTSSNSVLGLSLLPLVSFGARVLKFDFREFAFDHVLNQIGEYFARGSFDW